MSWRWDVALSFAGAQRPYVERVARGLARKGVRCFYDADRLTSIELWGTHLTESLPRVYGEQAAIVVIFISTDYAARDWTNLERRAALTRAARERREYILPARFDDTELPGLISDLVSVDLNGYEPERFADLLASKLQSLGITAAGGASNELSTPPGPRGGLSLENTAWQAHWDPRARGVENSARKGWYFTGRVRALGRIRDWIVSPAEGAQPLVVVTGGPGSGKSAVLARIVTLSDEDYRATMPGPLSDEDPLADLPVATVDVAVHARAMSAAAVLEMIAAGLGVDLASTVATDEAIDHIVRALLSRKRRLTVVIDALDESEDPRMLASLLSRIGLEAADSRLRLLVGTRPGGPTRRYLSALGMDMSSDNVIDLDSSAYLARDDLVEYIRRRLLRDGSPYQDQQDLARPVADAVAEAAYPTFLIGQLVTASLVKSPRAIGPGDPRLREFPRDVSAAMDRYLIDLGDQQERVEDILRPLAYARGDGLPHDRHAIWPILAKSLARFGRTYTDSDIESILTAAEDYLIETVVDAESVYYRFYHQALADLLRSPQRNPARSRSLNYVIYEGLLGSTARDANGNRDWSDAHPYLLRHLPGHAADANALIDLLGDTGFLVWAEPPGVLAALQQSGDARGSRLAQIYRAGYHTFPGGVDNAGWRAAQLHLAARRFRDSLARQIEEYPMERPWTTRWTTGRLLAPHYVIGRHRAPVASVAVGKIDEKAVVLSCGHDHIARTWDLVTGLPTGTVLRSRRSWLTAVAVGSVKGRPVAFTCGDDESVRLWDLSTGQPVGRPLVGHSGPVNAVAVSELDGRTVAVSCGDDDTVRVWDLAGEELLYPPLRGHTSAVTCVAIGRLHKGPVAVTAGDDESVRLWDLSTGRPVGRPLVGHSGPVNAVAVSELDGRTVAVSCGDDDTVRVWDLAGEELLYPPLRGHTSAVTCVAIGQLHGKVTAMTGGRDGAIRAWDLASGRPLGSRLLGHVGSVTALELERDEAQLVVVTGGQDCTIRVWDPASILRSDDVATGHMNTVSGVTIGRLEGRAVAVSASWDLTVRTWDMKEGDEVGTPIRGHTKWITCVAFGTLGNQPIVVTGSYDDTVRIWDPATGGQLRDPLTEHINTVAAVAVIEHEDDALVVSSSWDETVRVRSLTGISASSALLVGHSGWVAALDTAEIDGRPVCITGSHDCTARVWDLLSCEPLGPPLNEHEGAVGAVALGHDGKRILAVTGSEDRTARIWDLSSGERESSPLLGHTGAVVSVAMGRLRNTPIVVTGSSDSTVRIWDIRDGASPIATIVLDAPVTAVRLDGKTIVVAAGLDVICVDLTETLRAASPARLLKDF